MKNLISIDDLTKGEILSIVKRAETHIKNELQVAGSLGGSTVVTLFFEESTRTRMSFEMAARKLSLGVLSFSKSTSSMTKGESLRDTIATFESFGVNALIVRHSSAGVPRQISEWTDLAIINAGDGAHSHPSQALLDIVAFRSAIKGDIPNLGSLARNNPDDFSGVKIGIVGDILHSRVARSVARAFSKLGGEVVLCGPPTLLPNFWQEFQLVTDLDSVISELDLVMPLRLQLERASGGFIPSLSEYRHRYGLTIDRIKKIKESAVILHPGPMNRGVEIDSLVPSDPRALVNFQVRVGVPTRMAILEHCLEGEYKNE
ncbi:MAG: aspartate carbamoyltransferase catalytic subunit [Acidimicrobiales bacterium]|nr:aspartate carbamoyltransferase catalytic subunit [Acidimicrobiales bacterium]